ncbi:MAG: SufD family Fe-S cluster assembly protein [Bacilli bacterium]|jgi:Fe-S cluster assembly protein SufD|nr:SufD family Fe-S cluster assembly protein [Bacilli bacterium]
MATTYLDFSALSITDNAIHQDTQLDFFLNAKALSPKTSLHFTVAKNVSLTLIFVDLLSTPLTLSVVVDLQEGSKADVKVASLCPEGADKIFSINVNHFGKKSYSRTTMAGINLGSSSLKFLGNSYIQNGASGSDTRQEGKITNLSPNSHSEVSPALLIKENDVKASHGAALGAYNPDVLYYLMSRGLSLDESKKLITFGNLLPVIESLQDKNRIDEAKKVLGSFVL